MAPSHGAGRRSAGGLRATWERQQRAAELAAAAERMPRLARSKPAFLAAQLQPVLLTLRQAAEDHVQKEEEEEGQQPQHAVQSQLATAAAHLRRLVGLDRQADANTSLLLWLLLETAIAGEAKLQGALLHQLCVEMGWQALLLEALVLCPLPAQPGYHALLPELAAVAAASAAGSGDPRLQLAVQQVVQSLAGHVHQLLSEYGGGGSSSSSSSSYHALLASAEALQQVLLVCPDAAAAPAAAAALRRLQASTDACAAGLMKAMQQPQGEQQERHRAVFQQLCQLRARLMLAGAASGASAEHAAAPGSVSTGPAASTSSDARAAAAQAWRTVLLMPANVAAAARMVSDGGASEHPHQLQLLAGCVAARSYLPALCSSAAGTAVDTPDERLGLHTSIAALPGVRFEPPQLPCHAPATASKPGVSVGSSSDAAALSAAAEAAEEEVNKDPGCLGPVQLAVGALRMAREVAAEGRVASTAWPQLLDLAAAAAATMAEPREQQQLLLLVLHGQEAWQRGLRAALADDEQLQHAWRRELVAVFNRLASDPSTGGSAAQAVVHGEERQRRTAAAVAVLLPYALLCPAAVLERLVRDAVVQAGEQVGLLLDVLHEMAPLAAYRPGPGQPPLLLSLLARHLVPGKQHSSMLDTPASRDAFLQLAAGLCGRLPATRNAVPAAGSKQGALLSPADVLQHVVAPALQQEGAGEASLDFLLPLQLAQLVLGAAGGAAPGAGGAALQPHLAVLQPLLGGWMDLDRRRIDRSTAALEASSEAYELAASMLGQAGSSGCSAGSYLQQQLQAARREQAASAAEPQQQLQRLRRRMLQLLAALLPCLTTAEAEEVLQATLPAAIQALLLPAAAEQPGGAVLPGAHAAAVEAACRAAQALALQPQVAAIAGEELAATAGAGAAQAPSPLRQAAVERTLQHLTRYCARLAAAPAVSTAATAGGRPEEGKLALRPAEAQALGLRCFRELCQLAAMVQRAGYDCGTLQAGLVQLVQQLLALRRVAAADPEAATAQLLPPQQVAEQLAAAAGGLPEGRLRDLVSLGIQQAAASSSDAP